MIEGVKVIKKNIFCDERGRIMHMMKKEDAEFEKFGEIYFSTIYPNVIKGWHLHKEMVLNYVVVKGMIKLVLYDDRENSSTKGEINEIFIGENNYCLVQIPKNVWNGFKCVGTKEAIVANCSTISHDKNEIVRKDPFTKEIPYDWTLKNG